METKVITKKVFGTKFIATVGILSGISVVLMMILEFPIPFMPPFLKFDFSNVPVMVGAFAFGPVIGIAIAFIKSLLHLLVTTTGGVGELADFLASATLVGLASFIYTKGKTKKTALIGMIFGTIGMAIVGGLANKFILIPFYSNMMPIEQILELCGKVNPFIKDVNTYVLFGAVPFNFIKGGLICLITSLVYKKISKVIN